MRRVEEIYGAFARGDVPAVLDQLAEDVDWYDPGPKGSPPRWALPRPRRFQVYEDTARELEAHTGP